MCFEINSTKRPRPKTAKKDIPVWKVITNDGDSPMFHMKDGSYNIMKWEPGYHYTEEPTFSKNEIVFTGGLWEIHGSVLHSKTTLKGAEDLNSEFLHRTMMVAEMYIPKGALYMENKEEYVSSDLVYDSLPEHKLNNNG